MVKIFSTTTLPCGYRQTAEINLAKDHRLAIRLNIAGLILMVLSLLLLGAFLRWARPDLSIGARAFWPDLRAGLGLLAAVAVTMLVHELIHGFFFRLFTGSRPVFAVRPLYAFAAAPDWLIPARHYWIIGLAPLALINAAGLLCMLLAPAGWIPLLVLLVTLNTGGSVGDIFIVVRLLGLSRDALARDAGDRVSFFEPLRE